MAPPNPNDPNAKQHNTQQNQQNQVQGQTGAQGQAGTENPQTTTIHPFTVHVGKEDHHHLVSGASKHKGSVTMHSNGNSGTFTHHSGYKANFHIGQSPDGTEGVTVTTTANPENKSQKEIEERMTDSVMSILDMAKN